MDAKVQALEESLGSLTQQLGDLVRRLSTPAPEQDRTVAANGEDKLPVGRREEHQAIAPPVPSNIVYTQKKGKLDFDVDNVIKVLEESVVNNPSKKLKARNHNEIKAYLKLARY